MEKKPFYLDPCNNYYLGDCVLYQELFYEPFPRDIEKPHDGSVTLGRYFTFEADLLDTEDKNKKGKGIIANENFYSINKKTRIATMSALAGFLKFFNRPCTEYYIHIPQHENVKYDPLFEPLRLVFYEPSFLCVSKQDGSLGVRIEKNFYAKIYHYTNGENIKPPADDPLIDFPPFCFCGVGLHH